MNIYVKYIIKRKLLTLLVVISVFVLMIWLTQSMRFIELITSKGIDFVMFLQLTMNLIIPMCYIAIPASLMISTIIVVSNLHQSGELTILRSSGISTIQFIKPFFISVSFIIILHYLISFYLMPQSYRQFKDMQSFLQNNFISILFEEGVFNTQGNAFTVYIQKKESDNIFIGILIYDFRNSKKPITILADKGILDFDDAGPSFILYNGSQQIEDKVSGKILLAFFDSYKFSLKGEINNVTSKYRDFNEMFITQLLDGSGKTEKDLQASTVHAVQRIIWPLYDIILPVLVISILLTGQFSRKGDKLKFFIVSLAGGGVISIFLMFNNLALRNYAFMPTLFIVPIFIILFIAILIWHSDYRRL
jgi:lipopolysaccharide export system permease protein